MERDDEKRTKPVEQVKEQDGDRLVNLDSSASVKFDLAAPAETKSPTFKIVCMDDNGWKKKDKVIGYVNVDAHEAIAQAKKVVELSLELRSDDKKLMRKQKKSHAGKVRATIVYQPPVVVRPPPTATDSMVTDGLRLLRNAWKFQSEIIEKTRKENNSVPEGNNLRNMCMNLFEKMLHAADVEESTNKDSVLRILSDFADGIRMSQSTEKTPVGLSEEEKSALRALCEFLDHDADGSIDVDEIIAITTRMPTVGSQLEETLQKIASKISDNDGDSIRSIDTDQNGTISYDEFDKWLDSIVAFRAK